MALLRLILRVVVIDHATRREPASQRRVKERRATEKPTVNKSTRICRSEIPGAENKHGPEIGGVQGRV